MTLKYGRDVSTTVDMTSIFVISPSRSPKVNEVGESGEISYNSNKNTYTKNINIYYIYLRFFTKYIKINIRMKMEDLWLLRS